MTRVRVTVTIEVEVLRAVRARAARLGTGDSDVIEEALRRDLGLDMLEQLAARPGLDDEAAMTLAVEAQHAMRR